MLSSWRNKSLVEKTMWLERNHPSNNLSRSLRRLIYDFGVNDEKYVTCPKIDGVSVTCPAYSAWASVIERCHSKIFHEKQPSYIGTRVCDEWKSFTEFRSWWVDNCVDGFEIDKDIIGDGTMHSPSCCIFVPRWINLFITDRSRNRGEFLIGVDYSKVVGKYRARCRNTLDGSYGHIGYFDDQYSAHLAWRERKLGLAAILKHKMDEVDERIFTRVVEIINNAR